MKRKLLSTLICLASPFGIALASTSAPVSMNGSWYKGVTMAGTTASSLGFKKGDTVVITSPANTYVQSSYGTMSLSSCTHTAVNGLTQNTCKLTYIGTYTTDLHLGVDAMNAAGTKASGSITFSGSKPQPTSNEKVTVTVNGLKATETSTITLKNSKDSSLNKTTTITGNNSYSTTVPENGDTWTVSASKVGNYSTNVSPTTFTASSQAQAIKVNYTGNNAQNDTVSFTVSGLPSNTRSSITLTNTKDSSTKTVAINGNGTYSVVVPKNGDSWKVSASNVENYTSKVTPATITANAQSQSVQVKYTHKVINETVNFKVSGLPTGKTATITLTDSKDSSLTKTIAVDNNGNYSTVISGNGDTWNVSVSSVTDYYASFSERSFVANKSSENITLSFEKDQPNNGTIFSPYKDTTINMNWNTDVISTRINGVFQTFVKALPPKDKVVSLAFATGSCTKPSWGGVPADKLAKANIPLFVENGIKYIISTGGAAGSFSCYKESDLANFISQYASKNLIGIDYDIEGGYTQGSLDSLMQVTAEYQKTHPNLRVSLTLATLARPNSTVNILGVWALNAAQKAGLKYNVNLMVMDYGNTGCQQNSLGQCDMAKSAIYAAKEFSKMYNIPLSRIALTPMLGQNDTSNEITTVADMKEIAEFVKDNGLAGMHYWSFDRDVSCGGAAPGLLGASPTCSGIQQEPLAFNNAVTSVIS